MPAVADSTGNTHLIADPRHVLKLQEKHAASIAALEAGLALSKQDTLAAQAEAADARSLTEQTVEVSSAV